VSQRTGVKARSLERWLADGRVTRRRNQPELEVLSPELLEQAEPQLVAVIIAAAQRGSWQAAAWLLERRWPERWLRATQRPHMAPSDDDAAFAEIIELARRRTR
jgi:hypothetical protein